MTCIDTHSHLYGEEFDIDREEVMARARAAGVEKIFLPNINAASVGPMLDLCRRHPGVCHPMIGLHPEDVTDDWPQVLDGFEQMLQPSDHPFIAIGEVGLDYYWDRSRYEEQQEVFARQVGWALKYGLPLMIHTRNAHHEMMTIMRSYAAESHVTDLRGVFHCFGGTADEAAELLSLNNFMLGIGGIVTFKKSPLPETLRREVPLERIVIETDSPYLAPVPHRGQRNESAYVIAVAARLAEIYQVGIEEVCEITTSNALRTFPRAQSGPVFPLKTNKNAP